MVSKVDKIMVHENESLSEVNLLKGVKLIEGGYVCLVGLIPKIGKFKVITYVLVCWKC